MHFDMEVRALVHYYTTLACLWDIEGLNLIVCHDEGYFVMRRKRLSKEYDRDQEAEQRTRRIDLIAMVKW